MAKRLRGDPPSMFHDYLDKIDIAMRYETIGDDLRRVFSKVGMPTDLTIPSVNRTDERPIEDYRSFYSGWTRRAVAIAFSDDLRRYGYTF